MTLDEFAAVATTCVDAVLESERLELAYLTLGLAGEAGEIVEIVKKGLRTGDLDRRRVEEELGDVLYYWVRLCAAVERPPSVVLARSAEKIARRAAGRDGAPSMEAAETRAR